jgi:hypothetical protein
MGIFDSVGKALTELGLGQEDLRKVFRGTLERLTRSAPMTTREQRDGMCLALAAMLDELRARDVMTPDTHSELMVELKKWHTPPDAKA